MMECFSANFEANFVEELQLSQGAYLVAKRYGIAVDASNQLTCHSWKNVNP